MCCWVMVGYCANINAARSLKIAQEDNASKVTSSLRTKSGYLLVFLVMSKVNLTLGGANEGSANLQTIGPTTCKSKWISLFSLMICIMFVSGVSAISPDQRSFSKQPGVKHHQPHMAIIPVVRTTLKPRRYLKTRYMAESHGMLAMMHFNTSRPCLHLDNFVQIVDIKCKDGDMHLKFKSKLSANNAFNEWSSHPDLTLLVGQERKCNGKEVGTFEVSRMRLQDDTITVKTSRSLARVDVVTDWTLDVTQSSTARPKHSVFTGKSRRDLWEKLQQVGEWDAGKSNHLNLTANYDTTTKNAITKKIIMFELMQGASYCLECFTVGKADIHLKMRGRQAQVTDYNITVSGEIRGNMDLLVIMKHEFASPLKTLFTLPLLPVNVPGVMAIVPEFQVEAGVTFEGWGEIGVNTGFEFTLPLEVSMYSDNLNSKPTIVKSKKPSVRAHQTSIEGGVKGWLAFDN
jgi:hypothetical protein